MPNHFQCRIKILTLLLTTIFLFSATACGGKNETKQVTAEQNETNKVTKEETEAASANAKAASKLKLQKQIWSEQGITDYQIEMQKLCFCAPNAVRLMVFEIKDNKIESVRYADSNEEVNPELYSEYNTIDGLFMLAEQALAKDPADINIVYDDKYGYIREYTVDYQENIADDELTIIASNMKQNK